MLTKNVGTMKPAWSQQPCVARGMQPFGFPPTSHPGIPEHGAFGFPHGMQTWCSQVGKLSAAATLNTVWTEVGNDMIWPSAVTQGSCMQAPAVAPQSASLV